ERLLLAVGKERRRDVEVALSRIVRTDRDIRDRRGIDLFFRGFPGRNKIVEVVLVLISERVDHAQRYSSRGIYLRRREAGVRVGSRRCALTRKEKSDARSRDYQYS